MSVASAGVLLPGCAKQHDGDSCTAPSERDEDCDTAIGVVIAPDAAARDSADDAEPVDAAPDVNVDPGCPPFDPGNFNRLEDGACIPLGILLQYDGE